MTEMQTMITNRGILGERLQRFVNELDMKDLHLYGLGSSSAEFWNP